MSDEIDRLYDAECAFVGRVKQGDKETIEAAAEIDRLRAENERLTAEIVRLRAKVAKEIRAAAKGSVYAKGRSHVFICGLQDGYEAAAQIACNDHRIIDLALENENERMRAKNEHWRKQDDAIRAEFGGKRDGRATIECLREAFAAKWSEEDALFQATLDMKTKELRAENERLRAALREIAKPTYGYELFMPYEEAAEYFKSRFFGAQKTARAALEGKP